MKKLTIILFLIISAQAMFATNYYLDPANGKLENEGTLEKPFPSLEKTLTGGKTFAGGDTLFLMTGNHGNPVINGMNPKFIVITSAKGEKPFLESASFALGAPATQWELLKLTIGENLKPRAERKVLITSGKQSMFLKITQCDIHTIADSSSWEAEDWVKYSKDAITLKGNKHTVAYNYMKNIGCGVTTYGTKCTVTGNVVENFSIDGLRILGDNSVYSYNLVKEVINVDDNHDDGIQSWTVDKDGKIGGGIVKGNIVLGNVIINYSNFSPDRKFLGNLQGIAFFDGMFEDWTFMNNVVCADNWHGLTLLGAVNCKIINNTVFDPYLGIVYDDPNPVYAAAAGPIKVWIGPHKDKRISSKNIVRNNLVSGLFFESEESISDHNLIVPSTTADFDKYFKDWRNMNFQLRDSSLAINAGIVNGAPTIDANFNPRTRKAVNVGAYANSALEVNNFTIDITAEAADRELRSNNKHDWVGQPSLRVGGSGKNFDGAVIIPFALPPLNAGKKVLSAEFTINLEAIENSPNGNINLQGLIYRKLSKVLDTDFYQGGIYGDATARAIQEKFVTPTSFTGKLELSPKGKIELTDFVNSAYLAGAQAGDYIFLRLSPSVKDVKDYTRWKFTSANFEKPEKRPSLKLEIGSEGTESNTVKEEINQFFISPSPLHKGLFTVEFSNFKEENIKIEILDNQKKISFNKTIDLENGKATFTSGGDTKLRTGKYTMKVATDDKVQEKVFFVW